MPRKDAKVKTMLQPVEKHTRALPSNPMSVDLSIGFKLGVQDAEAKKPPKKMLGQLFKDLERAGRDRYRSFIIKDKGGGLLGYDDYARWCKKQEPEFAEGSKSLGMWLSLDKLGVTEQHLNTLKRIYLQQGAYMLTAMQRLKLYTDMLATDFACITWDMSGGKPILKVLQILPKTPEAFYSIVTTKSHDRASDRAIQLRYDELLFTESLIELDDGHVKLLGSRVAFGASCQDMHFPVREDLRLKANQSLTEEMEGKTSFVSMSEIKSLGKKVNPKFTKENRAEDLRAMADQLEDLYLISQESHEKKQSKGKIPFEQEYVQGLQKSLRHLAKAVESGKAYSHTHELYLKWQSYWVYLRFQDHLGDRNHSDYNLLERVDESIHKLNPSGFNVEAIRTCFQEILLDLLNNGATNFQTAGEAQPIAPFSYEVEEADAVAQTYFAFSEIMGFLCDTAEGLESGETISHVRIKEILAAIEKFNTPNKQVSEKFKSAVYRYLGVIMFRYLERVENMPKDLEDNHPRMAFYNSQQAQIKHYLEFFKVEDSKEGPKAVAYKFSPTDYPALSKALENAAHVVELQQDLEAGQPPVVPVDCDLDVAIQVEKNQWRNQFFAELQKKYAPYSLKKFKLSLQEPSYQGKLINAFAEGRAKQYNNRAAPASNPSEGAADRVDLYFLAEANDYYNDIYPAALPEVKGRRRGDAGDSKDSKTEPQVARSHFKRLQQHFSPFKARVASVSKLLEGKMEWKEPTDTQIKQARAKYIADDITKKQLAEIVEGPKVALHENFNQCLKALERKIFEHMSSCLGIGVIKDSKEEYKALEMNREKLDTLLAKLDKFNDAPEDDQLLTSAGCHYLIDVLQCYSEIDLNGSLALAQQLVMSRMSLLPDKEYGYVRDRLNLLKLDFSQLRALTNLLGDISSKPDIGSLVELSDLFWLQQGVPSESNKYPEETLVKVKLVLNKLTNELAKKKFTTLDLRHQLWFVLKEIAGQKRWAQKDQEEVIKAIQYYRCQTNPLRIFDDEISGEMLDALYIESSHLLDPNAVRIKMNALREQHPNLSAIKLLNKYKKYCIANACKQGSREEVGEVKLEEQAEAVETLSGIIISQHANEEDRLLSALKRGLELREIKYFSSAKEEKQQQQQQQQQEEVSSAAVFVAGEGLEAKVEKRDYMPSPAGFSLLRGGGKYWNVLNEPVSVTGKLEQKEKTESEQATSREIVTIEEALGTVKSVRSQNQAKELTEDPIEIQMLACDEVVLANYQLELVGDYTRVYQRPSIVAPGEVVASCLRECNENSFRKSYLSKLSEKITPRQKPEGESGEGQFLESASWAQQLILKDYFEGGDSKATTHSTRSHESNNYVALQAFYISKQGGQHDRSDLSKLQSIQDVLSDISENKDINPGKEHIEHVDKSLSEQILGLLDVDGDALISRQRALHHLNAFLSAPLLEGGSLNLPKLIKLLDCKAVSDKSAFSQVIFKAVAIQVYASLNQQVNQPGQSPEIVCYAKNILKTISSELGLSSKENPQLQRNLLIEAAKVTEALKTKRTLGGGARNDDGLSCFEVLKPALACLDQAITSLQQLGRKRPRLFPGYISPARETRADGDQRGALHGSPLETPSPLTPAQAPEISFVKTEEKGESSTVTIDDKYQKALEELRDTIKAGYSSEMHETMGLNVDVNKMMRVRQLAAWVDKYLRTGQLTGPAKPPVPEDIAACWNDFCVVLFNDKSEKCKRQSGALRKDEKYFESHQYHVLSSQFLAAQHQYRYDDIHGLTIPRESHAGFERNISFFFDEEKALDGAGSLVRSEAVSGSNFGSSSSSGFASASNPSSRSAFNDYDKFAKAYSKLMSSLKELEEQPYSGVGSVSELRYNLARSEDDLRSQWVECTRINSKPVSRKKLTADSITKPRNDETTAQPKLP